MSPTTNTFPGVVAEPHNPIAPDKETYWVQDGQNLWRRIGTMPCDCVKDDDISLVRIRINECIESTRWTISKWFQPDIEDVYEHPSGFEVKRMGDAKESFLVTALRDGVDMDKKINDLLGDQVAEIIPISPFKRAIIGDIALHSKDKTQNTSIQCDTQERQKIDAVLATLKHKGVIQMTEYVPTNVPEHAGRHVYLLNQMHFNFLQNLRTDEVEPIYQVLQAIHHLQHSAIGTNIYLEGEQQVKISPAMSKLNINLNIEGKELPIFDEQIQKKLFDDLNGFTLFRQINDACISENLNGNKDVNVCNFIRPDRLYGVEDPAAHRLLLEMKQQLIEAYELEQELGLSTSLQIYFPEKNQPQIVRIGDKGITMPLTAFIAKAKRLYEIGQSSSRLQSRREEGVIQYACSLLEKGEIPIIVYGAAHKTALTEGFKSFANVHNFQPSSIPAESEQWIASGASANQKVLCALYEYIMENAERMGLPAS